MDEWVFRLFHQERLGLDYISLNNDSPADVERWVKRWVKRWIGLTCNVATLERDQLLAEMQLAHQRRAAPSN